MNACEELALELDKRGMRLGGVTLGDNPGTPDDVAREILRVLAELDKLAELGQYPERVFCYDSPGLTAATGMTEEQRRENPEEFQKRYREAATAR